MLVQSPASRCAGGAAGVQAGGAAVGLAPAGGAAAAVAPAVGGAAPAADHARDAVAHRAAAHQPGAWAMKRKGQIL